MPESILQWGIIVVLTLQALGDWLIGPMNLFTFTGSTEFYLLVLPAIYWSWDTRLGLRVGVALLLSVGLNSILKVVFHDLRPYWVEPRVRLLTAAETVFGIPSGHSQNSVVILGLLATYLRKGWAWIGAIVLIFLIGLSRIFLGVHFPTDVFVGWAIGIILLLLILGLESPIIHWLKQFGEMQQIAIMFAFSVVFIALGVLVSRSVSAVWQLPIEWVENAAAMAPDEPIMPFSNEIIIISAGALFGLIAGAIYFNSRSEFDPGGSAAKRVGRYLLGAIVVFILWRGLGELFSLIAADETLLGYILRYIRYSLIGAWISAWGPIVFIRLGLAGGQNS